MWRSLLAVCLLLLSVIPAQAQAKRAFVVGVEDYSELPKLTRTVEDAQGYTEVFREDLGFAVTSLPNSPNRAQFNRTFGAFLETIRPGDEVVFVFSGHGWSDGAENYLAMADAKRETSEFERREDTIALSRSVLHELRNRNASIVIAIIDACRDNPFDGGTKSGFEKGLVRVDAHEGMLVVYAAGERQRALDRLGDRDRARNSVFTRVFLPKLRDGHRPLMEAVDETRDEVARLAATISHLQRPAVYSDLSFKFCLAGRCKTGAPIADAESQAWLGISAAQDKESLCTAYKAHELAYPTGRHAAAARQLSSSLCGTLPRPRFGTSLSASASENAVGKTNTLRDTLASGALGPEMVVVPRGIFTMGSPEGEPARDDDEGPQRTVRIGYDFAVGKFEVTWAEYLDCVADGACPVVADDGFGQGDRPVTNVSWEDAKKYTFWLSAKSGQTYRLLSEAEWEYAARAGTTTAFSFGATLSTSDANFDGRSADGSGMPGIYRQQTVPVGSFPANAFGLHDLHGNVWEWVEDCYEADTSRLAVDGSAFSPQSCALRQVRGGSWNISPRNLRSANRLLGKPDVSGNNLGFRVARTVD